MNIAEIEKEIEEEFSFFEGDWEAKYEHLIDIGKFLPLIDTHYRTEERLIKGCQSQVWLHSELKNGKVYFTADSDAINLYGGI